jgi:hypothetical protein
LAIKHHLKYSIQINQTLMHFRFELALY